MACGFRLRAPPQGGGQVQMKEKCGLSQLKVIFQIFLGGRPLGKISAMYFALCSSDRAAFIGVVSRLESRSGIRRTQTAVPVSE